MNYDQKSQEVDSKNRENETLSEQLSEKLNTLNNIEVQWDPVITATNIKVTPMYQSDYCILSF